MCGICNILLSCPIGQKRKVKIGEDNNPIIEIVIDRYPNETKLFIHSEYTDNNGNWHNTALDIKHCPFCGENLLQAENEKIKPLGIIEGGEIKQFKITFLDFESAVVMKEKLNEVIAFINNMQGGNSCIELSDQPAGSTAREIIRCKECKHFITDGFNRTMCNRSFTMFEMGADDFCSYGERRGEQ